MGRPDPGRDGRGPHRAGHERLRTAARRAVEPGRGQGRRARQLHAVRLPELGEQGGTQTGTDGGNSYLVNLPAAAATSGVGFSFGHIANTLSLDLKLSAMETLGQTKLLSNPKVLVVQNQKALINVGNQLPVTKTDTEGNRTVEWKDVGIMLEVTPQVTNDNRIFLESRSRILPRGPTCRPPTARCSRSTPAGLRPRS